VEAVKRALHLVVACAVLASLGAAAATADGGVATGRVIVGGGVKVETPQSWRAVDPAGDGGVVDPRTVLVVGSPGVAGLRSPRCQVAAYRVPADGAVVVVVRWRSVTSGGGHPVLGRTPLRKLMRVSRPSFECFAGRGAAAQVALGTHAYQVNVMVGDRATPARVHQALAVARSFDLDA
jgi:hypothetical protein